MYSLNAMDHFNCSPQHHETDAAKRKGGPGVPGSTGFTVAKDDGSGGDNWSYKSCKAPVKSSPPTNQHPTFHRLDALPVSQPTVSKH